MSVKDSAILMIGTDMVARCVCGHAMSTGTFVTLTHIRRMMVHECPAAPKNCEVRCAQCGYKGYEHATGFGVPCEGFTVPHPCRACGADVGRGGLHRFGCALHGARQIKITVTKE